MRFAVAGLGLLLAGTAPAAHAQDTVLRCGRLLDVRTGELTADARVVVRDGRIAAVGHGAAGGAGAREVDLGDATCLPGLMDLHVHLVNSSVERSSARNALDGVRNAQRMLRSGFTTIRTPGDGDRWYANIEIRDAVARGDFTGPRMFVAPHALTATGGHADMNELAPDVMVSVQPGGRIVSGVDGMREAVREQVKYGADWIKIYATGGVMSAGDDPAATAFTDEELRAGVSEAHRHGKKVTVHAIGTAGIRSAVEAGVDAVEHGILIDDETIRLMVERGTVLVPTLYVLNYVVDEGPRLGYREESVAKGRALLPERDRRLRAAFSAGVKVAYGSDTIFPHEQAVREFGHLVRLGLTPLRALQAATVNAAELLGIDGEAGTLEAGRQADIVAVRGNPLDDIGAMERVRFVMKAGEIVRSEP